MKKLFIILFILLFSSVGYAQQRIYFYQPIIIDHTIYATPVPASHFIVPPPIKPNFSTPIRDSLYYGMYYQRVWRWNILSRQLGVQPVTPQ